MTIVTRKAPSGITVDGAFYPIDTSFRCGLRVAKIIDHPSLGSLAKTIAILENYFERDIPNIDLKEALEECMDFFNLCAVKKGKGRKQRRVFDWDADEAKLIADFQSEYRIDLTDPCLELHWWRFWTLFEGLSDTSKTMAAIGYRAVKIDPKLPKEEQKRLRAMKDIHKLPPRTASEVQADD